MAPNPGPGGREQKPESMASPPSTTPSGEAMLMVTLWMVGLPVEVQVKDGSRYSGVFHTASPHHGYGVVLKKVKKIGKGKDPDDEDDATASMGLGDFVDTLVVLPQDLVQVFVKDSVLPSEASSISFWKSTKEQESFTSENLSQEHASVRANTNNQLNAGPASNSTAEFTSSPSTSVTSNIECDTSSDVAAAKPSSSGKSTAMESKLNPSAKVYSPPVISLSSSAKVFLPAVGTLSASAEVFSPSDVYPLVNSNYASSTYTEVPAVGPLQPNILPSFSSLSSKAVAYNKLDPGNCRNGTHYFQPVMQHNASVVDPVGVGYDYQSAQVAPAYVTSIPQTVMAGKSAPLVYFHPVSQGAIPGAPITSQGWCRPMLMSPPPYQASFQKIQGAAPLYFTPPVMVTGTQPLVLPFQALQPMVPAGSGVFISKYQYNRS